MRVIPVLDLMGGVVVRGVAGKRAEYRPVVSRLTASSAPVDVARAFRDHFALTELYVADLDAIAGGPPARAVYAALHGLGCRLWVDAGLRTADAAGPLADAGVESFVAGLETVVSPAVIEKLCERYGTRIVFSLDLRGGAPLGDRSTWGASEPAAIAARAVAAGVRRLLVLDLARVGVGEGLGTDELCTRLAAGHPDVELAAGGGVRGVADLRRLAQCGVGAVLVASALHDGRLRPEDLATPEWLDGPTGFG